MSQLGSLVSNDKNVLVALCFFGRSPSIFIAQSTVIQILEGASVCGEDNILGCFLRCMGMRLKYGQRRHPCEASEIFDLV